MTTQLERRNGSKSWFQTVGIGNIITWIVIIAGFYANYMVLESKFESHLSSNQHLSAEQIYWLKKIEKESGFTWKPEEKGEFLIEFNELKRTLKDFRESGMLETPLEKEIRIRKMIEEYHKK